MSSPGSSPAAGGPPQDRQESGSHGGSETAWHPAREWLEGGEDEGEDEGEGEDEDEDFQPWSDGEDNDDMEDIWEDDDANIHPGAELNIEFALDGDGGGGIRQVSTSDLLNIITSNGLYPFFQNRRDNTNLDEDDDDDNDIFDYRRRPARRGGSDQFPKVPSEAGMELMSSGDFGRNSHYVDDLKKRKKALATKLMWRELGIDTNGMRERSSQLISQDMIPSSTADKIIHYDSRCYSGQFSDDGNFFYSCAQDFKVRMYDTSNPYEWKYYKTVDYPYGQWTITDATLSPDNRFLAYSSIRNLVCLSPTDPADKSDPTILDLSVAPGGRSRRGHYGSSYFGIWSLRFSGDGREIVAGTSDHSVVVYDIETRQSVMRISNHDDDVNAVCFGDTSSPHILYSGSDDTTLRVWDRRSMGDGREAGVFMGHTEGLTYVDSKGDGRYILSNGKDQSMKLWDLRKMMTASKFDTIDANHYTTGFDYRFEPYPDDYYEPHPHDCSVVTFRGHRVLKTLIRCHFSPPGSTNSRYVYTGSEDGKVYVYNLDATLAGTIDVGQATLNSRPHEPDIYTTAYEIRSRNGEMAWRTCVRDASWHPNVPALAATSWNGWGLSSGTCTLHSWNDSAVEDEGQPPVGMSYNSKLEFEYDFNYYNDVLRPESTRSYLRSRPVRRQYTYNSSGSDGSIGEDEDEDEEW